MYYDPLLVMGGNRMVAWELSLYPLTGALGELYPIPLALYRLVHQLLNFRIPSDVHGFSRLVQRDCFDFGSAGYPALAAGSTPAG